MTIKQYYLNMIKEGMMEGDERKIQYYERELNKLVRKEFEEKIKNAKVSK